MEYFTKTFLIKDIKRMFAVFAKKFFGYVIFDPDTFSTEDVKGIIGVSKFAVISIERLHGEERQIVNFFYKRESQLDKMLSKFDDYEILFRCNNLNSSVVLSDFVIKKPKTNN